MGQALQPANEALEGLVEIPSPVDGFSLAALADLTKEYGLGLVAVRRTQGQDLIVPSVIHWRQNHYAAILQRQDGNYLVNDPTFGKPRWMQADAINEEASGCFLIPATQRTSNWQPLGTGELAAVHGKGLPNNINDAKDKGAADQVFLRADGDTWGTSHQKRPLDEASGPESPESTSCAIPTVHTSP